MNFNNKALEGEMGLMPSSGEEDGGGPGEGVGGPGGPFGSGPDTMGSDMMMDKKPPTRVCNLFIQERWKKGSHV